MIPEELKRLNRWVVWKIESPTGARATKIPYRCCGSRRAKSNDPATWGTYRQAVAGAERSDVAGIGIMLGLLDDGRTLCGVDLDDCIVGGAIVPEADDVVRQLDTYWEVSPSGNGFKCIGFGRKPVNSRSTQRQVGYGRIEVYDSGRWFALTGQRYTDRATVEDIEDPLGDVCRATGLVSEDRPPSKPAPIRRPPADDVERRASAYLATMDPAVQGASGHSALLRAACAMAHGFDMGRDRSVSILAAEYNPRCSPPWDLSNPKDRRDFERKVDEALKISHDHPRGHLLVEELPAATGYDFSHLASKPKASATAPKAAPRPGRLPHHVLQAPGMVGRIAAWINDTARYKQPELALGNAIAFTGALLGKKVRGHTDARTNFYCLGLGESCTGKNHSRTQIAKLAYFAGVDHLIGGEDVTSDAAILRLAAAQPACLLQFDEIGHFFRASKSSNAQTYEARIVPLLTKLFTSSNTVYGGKEYAKEENSTGKIYEPCVCLYGTATPGQVWDSVTLEQVQDGFLGRMLIFASSDDDPDLHEVGDTAPPKDLVGLVAAWGGFKPPATEGAGNIARANPGAMTVSPTAGAAKMLKDFYAEARSERKRLKDDGGLHPLWGRAHEQALKLALVGSIDRPDVKPVVDEAAASWAIDLVRCLVSSMVYAASGRVTETRYERDRLRVLDAIRRSGGGATKRQLALACRWLRAKDRDEIIQDLLSSGQIEVEVVPPGSSGGPSTVRFTAQ